MLLHFQLMLVCCVLIVGAARGRGPPWPHQQPPLQPHPSGKDFRVPVSTLRYIRPAKNYIFWANMLYSTVVLSENSEIQIK
jgi:hypothetical protein